MKRLIPILSLFLFMCLVGAGASIFLAQDAMAENDLPACDGTCSGPVVVHLSCVIASSIGYYECSAEAPYAVILAQRCSGEGWCSGWVVDGCHDDYFGYCD